ncbi:putative methyltransferase-domain-containing protein [Pterulicium gracile]|uniref:Putative methyltransferase-domain-containing protein n=1 Tax=Pterulicium gracile TaxID=1884261 RepID=A0A5C3QV18_9AGAR|nr:putative methyltransferase-domain-containing protein [Pterula gracilis]
MPSPEEKQREDSQEDFLSDSLQSLWGIAEITRSSGGELFVFEHAESATVVTLRTPDTTAANWRLHANSIWSASVFLAQHIRELHLDSYSPEGSVRVLELGAGAGLPGITIAKTYPDALVVVSDYPDPLLIDTLRENTETNGVSSRCFAAPYDWGTDSSHLLPAAHRDGPGNSSVFDVIIAADTLWNSDFHPIFLRSLELTLRKSTSSRAHIIAGFHTGRYTLDAFLKMVEGKAGNALEIEKIEEKAVVGDAVREWSVQRAETEAEEDRRGWLLWVTLRWRLDVSKLDSYT